VTLIEAEMNAKKEQVAKVVASEAQKESDRNIAEADKIKLITAAEASRDAALRDAERMQTMADAEARVADKKRHAMEQEAEGAAAQKAAPGLAEARILTARSEARKQEAEGEKAIGLAEAEVIRAKGGAEAAVAEQQAQAEAEGIKDKELAAAAGIEARGLAEAKGIEEKAKSMKLLHEAGQQHEEFRMRLAKDREVELAEINVQKDIAMAHSSVVGEALKSAKIDIVGGENDFFEKVVRAVGSGKAVDKFVNNSQTITDVKNALFTGGPGQLQKQLQQWVKDFGFTSEDLKNLTIAALITKMIASTDEPSVRALLQSARSIAKDLGWSDAPAETALSGSAPVGKA
jgi:hypothetical protein